MGAEEGKLALPGSVLFCCDHNAVRSPMAEGIMKKLYGASCYIQSVGLQTDLEIDGFAIAVCREIGVELERHRARSFDTMGDLGDDLASFDLLLALSPASRARAAELARHMPLDIDYWPISDPTMELATDRETRLAAYRHTRDQLIARMESRFGPPKMR